MKDNPMQHDQVTTRIAVMLFRILQFFPEENHVSYRFSLYYQWDLTECILKVLPILAVGIGKKYFRTHSFLVKPFYR